MRLTVDTTALETPPNFFRPSIETLSLVGLPSDGSIPIVVAIGVRNDEGQYDFVSQGFQDVLQEFLLGAEPYSGYEIRFPASSLNTIDALVVHDMESETAVPEIFVTFTEAN